MPPILTRSQRIAQSSTNMPEFEGLGRSGVSDIGGKIETFPCPRGLDYVELETDEVTAVCPITGQPDFYLVRIAYNPREFCAESKSVKLYLQSFRERGAFGEQLACMIADHFQEALQADSLSVTVIQKPRGGISIESQATRRFE